MDPSMNHAIHLPRDSKPRSRILISSKNPFPTYTYHSPLQHTEGTPSTSRTSIKSSTSSTSTTPSQHSIYTNLSTDRHHKLHHPANFYHFHGSKTDTENHLTCNPTFSFQSLPDVLNNNDQQLSNDLMMVVNINNVKNKAKDLSKNSPARLISFILVVSVFILALIAVSLMVALIIVASGQEAQDVYKKKLFGGEGERVEEGLRNEFDGMRIRESIRWLSQNVHVAGTVENMDVMERIEKEMMALGLEVTTQEYDVLLDYPDYNNPNTITYCEDKSAKCHVLSSGLSEVMGSGELAGQEDDPRALVQWVAYAKNGTITSNVVYVNYGTLEDYQYLSNKSVSVKDAIVIIRYGAVFRGDKVELAAEHGAKGVIIYTDPADYAPNLGKDKKTFPDNIFLPKRGAQRGSLAKVDGDPLTPFYPSLNYTLRTETEEGLRERNILPNIPVATIGYEDALSIIKLMDGTQVASDDWIGGLNTTYRFTGTQKITLTVNSRAQVRKIKNVMAKFQGATDPDKWVLLGNHVDAWVKGAIDPNSGTATLLEAARVLTTTSTKLSWRPKRSIVFCFWDAEEYGLIGSTEFVEQYLKPLQRKAIAYLNVDNINGNNTLSIKAVPMIYRLVVESAKKIPHPNPEDVEKGLDTLYDGWQFYNPRGPIAGDKSIPEVRNPGSGSDFQRFISYLGIPVLDLKMTCAPYANYMLYHTMYEVPWTTEHLIDTTHQVFSAVGQMWMELTRNLADSLIIPFNVEDYAIKLDDFVKQTDVTLKVYEVDVGMGRPYYKEKMEMLKDSIKRFGNVAVLIQNVVEGVNNGHVGVTIPQINTINSILQHIEKNFILEQGIYPKRAFYRHTVFTSSEHDEYAGKVFSLIMDPVFEWDAAKKANNPQKQKEWLNLIDLGFTKLQYTIESAILGMDLSDFNSVLFGLKVLMQKYDFEGDSNFYGIPVPGKYVCWAELAIIQMITPNVSFLGHLSGILAGLVYWEVPFVKKIVGLVEGVVANVFGDILNSFNQRETRDNPTDGQRRRNQQYNGQNQFNQGRRPYGWNFN
uniref:PA domain-containing protein n=1 Tax=Rhabditophanes sp. KR3021 TaxID=114890 RepID=A0AC35TWT8_9BILA